jgi:hypothetical protein
MGLASRFVLRFAMMVLFGCAASLLTNGCGRWPQARTYEVTHAGDPGATFVVVEEVARAQNYQIVERNDPAYLLKLRTHVDENSTSKISYITVQVDPTGRVTLTPSGFLLRPDGTMHQRLHDELGMLEQQIMARLNPPAAAESGQSPAAAGDTATQVPHAWIEPSSDPARWGPGNFTCLPVHIPAADQTLIALRLESGELAAVTLSLAYDPTLCRSPAACPQEQGCPALGIGDAEQVRALAQRLQANHIGRTATLLHRGAPAVVLDLAQHGSVAQAMNQPGAGGPAAAEGATSGPAAQPSAPH